MVRVGGPNPQQIRLLTTSDQVSTFISGKADMVDLARKEYYDRNPLVIRCIWGGYVGAHGWTTRWTYTVPAGRKAIHSILFQAIREPIVTSGALALIAHGTIIDGVFQAHAQPCLAYGMGYIVQQTVTALFLLTAGQQLQGMTYNSDSVSHDFVTAAILTEFDE